MVNVHFDGLLELQAHFIIKEELETDFKHVEY